MFVFTQTSALSNTHGHTHTLRTHMCTHTHQGHTHTHIKGTHALAAESKIFGPSDYTVSGLVMFLIFLIPPAFILSLLIYFSLYLASLPSPSPPSLHPSFPLSLHLCLLELKKTSHSCWEMNGQRREGGRADPPKRGFKIRLSTSIPL